MTSEMLCVATFYVLCAWRTARYLESEAQRLIDEPFASTTTSVVIAVLAAAWPVVVLINYWQFAVDSLRGERE